MPNIPQSPLQDGFAMTDADLAALLAGKRDIAPWLQPVADVLAALSTEPSPGELAGEARALAEYRRRTGAPVPRHPARPGTAGLTSRLGVKAAAGATAAAVVLGGAATAAFANVLPAPIQRLAHDVIGAPDAPSAPQLGPARSKTVAPGQVASHGKPTASAGPYSTHRHPNRHGHGQPGTGRGQQGTGESQPGTDQDQQGNGQGQQGNGQGGAHAKGQGADPSGQAQPGGGQSQLGIGQGQGNPHAQGRYRNPRPEGLQGNPHPKATPTARDARRGRRRRVMDT
jgi:hypothetical protein